LKLKRIDEEKKKIEEDTSKRLVDEHHLKDLEKDKKLSDMEHLVEELKENLNRVRCNPR